MEHFRRRTKSDYTAAAAIDTTYEYSPMLDTTLVVYVPEKQILGPLNKYRIGFYLLSVLSAITVVLFSYWIFGNIHKPLQQLVRAFHKVEVGDLAINLSFEYKDEFGYLYMQFNEMVSRLKVLIHEVYEQQIRSQQSELKQLQSRILEKVATKYCQANPKWPALVWGIMIDPDGS